MTDAALKSGWYAVHSTQNKLLCIRRGRLANGEPYWDIPSMNWRGALPKGWHIGSAVEDLLRDAARYRWLLRNPGRLVDDLYDTDELAVRDNIDALIDAEIAREKENGNG